MHIDHCRIGSLEITMLSVAGKSIDHCRIGSLEILLATLHHYERRSLPHRQLRKIHSV